MSRCRDSLCFAYLLMHLVTLPVGAQTHAPLVAAKIEIGRTPRFGSHTLALSLEGSTRALSSVALSDRGIELRPLFSMRAGSGTAHGHRKNWERRQYHPVGLCQRRPTGYHAICQFSTVSPGTRWNSLVLAVTRMRPTAMAWAASSTS